MTEQRLDKIFLWLLIGFTGIFIIPWIIFGATLNSAIWQSDQKLYSWEDAKGQKGTFLIQRTWTEFKTATSSNWVYVYEKI